MRFCDICLCVFCFFKQKTAYEMRISDWSSDVCSSDLPRRTGPAAMGPIRLGHAWHRPAGVERGGDQSDHRSQYRCAHGPHMRPAAGHRRSEEHTSELQSLMRISYAVFCLKKKT